MISKTVAATATGKQPTNTRSSGNADPVRDFRNRANIAIAR